MKILSKIINSAASLAQKTGGGVSGSREVSKEMIALARRVAAEGIVLLKNNNDALPVRPDETVAVFGKCQIMPFYDFHFYQILYHHIHFHHILFFLPFLPPYFCNSKSQKL